MRSDSTAADVSVGKSVDGTASHVQVTDEKDERVIRFLVVSDDGRETAVELRGYRLRGYLVEGHRVRVPADRSHEGTLSPASIRDLTTGGSIEATRLTALRLVLIDARRAFVGALAGAVGAAMVSLVPRFEGGGQAGSGGRESGEGAQGAAIGLAVAAGLVLALLLAYEWWRLRRGSARTGASRIPSYLGGLVFGVLAIAAAVASET